jgi:hypothetical protein
MGPGRRPGAAPPETRNPKSVAIALSTTKPEPLTPACTACIELLLEQVAAGNELVEIEARLAAGRRTAGHAVASAKLERARIKRSEARDRWLEYQRQHRCHRECQNRCSQA